MIKKIGNWTIEYPAAMNGGKPSQRLAFVTGQWVSGFVCLYGNRMIGIDMPCNPPTRVIEFLRNLSQRLEISNDLYTEL